MRLSRGWCNGWHMWMLASKVMSNLRELTPSKVYFGNSVLFTDRSVHSWPGTRASRFEA